MIFNAMPECYNAKKRSNVAYGLGIVYGCLTLAFVIMTALVNDDVWIFSLLSLPMTVLCIHYSKAMKKDASGPVKINVRKHLQAPAEQGQPTIEVSSGAASTCFIFMYFLLLRWVPAT